MRIVIIAFGTRGDVQPAIALGKALQAGGKHQVRIVASANFKQWIAVHGLEAATSHVDIQALMESESGSDWIEHGNNPLRQLRVMRRVLLRLGMDMMMDAWRACRDAQVVISSYTSDVYAVSIAERLAAKHISMLMQPSLLATRSGAATLSAPLPNRNSIINYLFGKALLEPSIWQLLGDITNQFRQQELNLPPQTRRQNFAAMRGILVLHAYSPHVVPHPSDWPGNLHETGYWFLEEDARWQPPPDLLHFLEAGPPPICIGFGSMTGRNPQATTQKVIDAVAQSRQRAILLAGWAGIGHSELPDRVFRLEAAPHRWLFPRMAAVVHHGGAGTTAASLRAGVPTIIVPHLGDQPFWGQRVAALGAGPRAIPRPKLTAAALAAAIRTAIGTPSMRQSAAHLGACIDAEDGIGNAVELIERYLRT